MKSPTKVAASRRAVLGAPAVLFAASAAGAATPGSNAEAQSILERYHAFGDKAYPLQPHVDVLGVQLLAVREPFAEGFHAGHDCRVHRIRHDGTHA